MAGEVQGTVIGQSLQLDSATAVANAAECGATYAQAEVNAIVTQFNALLAELRSNGMIKS